MKRSTERWGRSGGLRQGRFARRRGLAVRTALLLVAASGGGPAPGRGAAPESAAPPPSLVRLALPAEADQRYPIGIPTDPAQSVELAFPWPVIDWAGRGFTPDPETYAGDFLVDARRGSPRLFVTPLVQGGHRVLHVVLAPPGTAPRTVLLEFLPAPPDSAWSKVTFVAAASARPSAAAAGAGERSAPAEDAAAANVRPPMTRTLRPAPSPYQRPTPEAQLGLIRTMRLFRTLPPERAHALVAADPALEWDDRRRAPRSFGPFILRLAFVIRDRTTDCLGLCVDVRNATRRRLVFDAESWVVRAGERVYPLRTADFANEIEPEAAAVAWLVLGRAQDGSPTPSAAGDRLSGERAAHRHGQSASRVALSPGGLPAPMKLLQSFGALSFRRQVVLVGATALIAAGLTVGRKGPPARQAQGAGPAGGITPTPPAAPLAEAGPTGALFATRLPPETLTPRESQREATPLAASYRREVVRPRPVEQSPLKVEEPGEAAPNATPHLATGGPANRRRDGKSTLPEIFRMPGAAPGAEGGAAPGSDEAARNAGPEKSTPPTPDDASLNGLSKEFAPFGRMIKCQLVNTLDSLTARTEPIIGLVTEDLAWNGRVIVPANTEVFSYALPRGLVDARGTGRLVDNGQWILVLPEGRDGENGRELLLKGRALDRRELLVTDRARARSWGIDDGADGLVGYTLSTLDEEEIKLFAAAAIGGLAQGAAAVAGRTQPAPGLTGLLGATEIAPTVADTSIGAAGQGAVAVANQLAARIRDEIAQRGYYVRVPAGKEFYLWVEQTIDPSAAVVGAELPNRAKDAARATLSPRPSSSP